MTKDEAAIVSAYTGFMLGDFGEFHEYAEKVIGRPIFTHEFANQSLIDELREKTKPDFVGIKVDD